MNPVGGSQEHTLFELCKKFGCLPSQIEKEEATIIDSFIVILDEQRRQEIAERDRTERENKLRMMS